MAGQLTPEVVQRFPVAGDAARIIPTLLLSTWHMLAREWESRAATPQSALMVLHPGMMRLIEHLALQPPPRPAAAAEWDGMTLQSLLACMTVITNVGGVVVDAGLHPAVKPWYTRASSGSSSSSSSMVDSPTTQQTIVLLGAEVRGA
jgi:hypothetical protein